MPLVKIKPGLSHGYYSTVTRALAYHRAGDEFDASPAEMAAFGDKFILVEEPAPDEPVLPAIEVDATPGARKLAQEHGINLALSSITGSGKDGRITKTDVQAALDGDAQ